MLDGSGKAVIGKPSRGCPDDACETPPKVGDFLPPTVPPIGFVPAVLAAKALWNWTFFGNPAGPQPVPPTPDEARQAAQLATMLSSGQATIVISGSVQTLP